MNMLSVHSYVTCVVVNIMIVWTVSANAFAPKASLLFAPTATFFPSSSRSHKPSFWSAFSVLSSSAAIQEVCTSSSNNEDEVEVLEEEFVKPKLDGRDYRSIRLKKNGLECLLVSDDETDVESAAVHVKAGHFNDPIDRAGLAHFHEHMLFLGTAKYPSEDEYESFLASYGGSSNAYTDMEDTNYYFSLLAPPLKDNDDDDDDDDDSVSEGLAGALDRFAQFFIQPNFDVDMLEREMQAVDSEYKNSLTSDNWRMYQTLKHTSNSDHPFSKFGCGNYETLSGKSTPRDDLFRFWNTYYRGPNMKLCVVGRSSLDALQKSVLDTFGNLPTTDQILSDNQLKPILPDNDDRIFPSYTIKEHKDDHDADATFFQQEYSKYGGAIAFGKEQLGNIRETIPVVEKRSIQLYFATPPMDDPVMTQTRPYRVLSHLLGHESPGTLHALLHEQGLINDLSSGYGVDTSDFSLCSLTLSMTPKGMKQREYVLDLVWQYIALIKQTMMNDTNLMQKYHDEMRNLSNMNFQWRENGDPTDFCSNAAEMLFEYPPSKILVGSSITKPYNDTITRQFFNRFTPDNCIISIVQPESNNKDNDDDSSSSSWQTEPWYGAKFRQTPISQELLQKWSDPNQTIDPRLSLPELNDFIPTDFSLRSDDECNQQKGGDEETEEQYRDAPPKLLQLQKDMEGLTMWHKMDKTFKVPKSYIRISITSPNVYRSPRSMTYARLFQKVLEDDLNSFLYDATMAGCYCKVFVTPSGFRINFTGFSEKLQLLVDVVTNRITSILKEMKVEHDSTSTASSSSLSLKFDKAVENLVRETKNFRLDSPYETATYNTRMLFEDNVWHVENYINEMEGKYAEKNPLTLQECASVVEECLSERTLVQSLCMGNIDDDGALKVADLIDRQFLSKSRPLTPEEVPRLRSVKIPTMEEAVNIFGKDVASSSIPVVLEAVVSNESEENHAVEVVLQAGSEHCLGYEGIAVAELIGHIAYNSAFNQLRTKEQLGYIVSAYTKKSAGGLNSFAVLVQSASTTPEVLEERVLNWLDLFRKELEEISPERYAMEAGAIVAQLLERNQRMSDEVSSSWGEILSTDPSLQKFQDPEFDRLKKLAKFLTVVESEGDVGKTNDASEIKTSAQLKQQVLDFFDNHFTPGAPGRRIMSSRVYGYSARSKYEANKEKAGVLSSYDEVRDMKRFLSLWPTAPYWI